MRTKNITRKRFPGGGNTAIDWASELEPIADKVYLTYRNEMLKGHEAVVERLKEKQLMQDAEESGETVVYREVERNRLHSANASFQANNGGVIALYASEGQNWRTVHTDMAGKEMKKVALGEQEALLIENAEEARYELAWMDESASEPIYYRVYTEMPELVTEDELFLFAAALSH